MKIGTTMLNLKIAVPNITCDKETLEKVKALLDTVFKTCSEPLSGENKKDFMGCISVRLHKFSKSETPKRDSANRQMKTDK